MTQMTGRQTDQITRNRMTQMTGRQTDQCYSAINTCFNNKSTATSHFCLIKVPGKFTLNIPQKNQCIFLFFFFCFFALHNKSRGGAGRGGSRIYKTRASTLGGGQPVLIFGHFFPKNCMKIKKLDCLGMNRY